MTNSDQKSKRKIFKGRSLVERQMQDVRDHYRWIKTAKKRKQLRALLKKLKKRKGQFDISAD